MMLTNFKEDAEPLESFFELNDTLFAKAQIPQTDCLLYTSDAADE